MAGLNASGAPCERVGDGPLISTTSHPELGTNINGPSLIRVPDWVPAPLGRYYLYFAHHQGRYIRMAYAEQLTGPWALYSPGVLQIEATAFNDHIASPDVHIDHAAKRITMHYHGCGYIEANPLPFEQVTCYAQSMDGLHFESERRYLAEPYLRTFRHDGWYYGFSGGPERRFSRSRDRSASFEPGPALSIPGELFPSNTQEGPGEYRMRHVALAFEDNQLTIYYSNVGDCPERIKRTRVMLDGDWHAWRASTAEEVLTPATAFEGVAAPLRASQSGDKHYPVHELRDPYVFEDGGARYLLYACAGEQGIALAVLN